MPELVVFACTAADVLGDGCVECGGWLHAEIRGGFASRGGPVCSEECAASATHRLTVGAALDEIERHLHLRDLLCACAEVCAPLGRPTAAELAEHAEWEASRG